MKTMRWVLLLTVCIPLFGCVSASRVSNADLAYSRPSTEPEWIRNGEPAEFEGELWYPTDEVENLLSAEVYLLGDIRGTNFFIDRMDVRPYERLYTYFAKNRYRAFEKRRRGHDLRH